MIQLQLKQRPHNYIDWSAALNDEQLTAGRLDNIHVSTLKSEYTEQLSAIALDRVLRRGAYTEPKFQKELHRVVSDNNVTVQECVTVTPDAITVTIDREHIDDTAIFAALDMVAAALNALEGRHGRVSFGEPQRFLTTETPLLYLH